MDLAEALIKKGMLKNPRLGEAFRKVDRKDFLPRGSEAVLLGVPDYSDEEAYGDHPLPIGDGQTISQPWTVAFMLELLDPRPGDNIMEIGYGSGWVTALMAYCGANIYAIERVPRLCEFGRRNSENFTARGGGMGEELSNCCHAEFFCHDGTFGLPEIAGKIGGFDKIIASAALKLSTSDVDSLPKAWRDQLKINGKIVVPIGHSIFEFIKKADDRFVVTEHRGFAFVPLISDNKINESRP